MSVFEGLGRNEEEWVGLLFLKKKNKWFILEYFSIYGKVTQIIQRVPIHASPSYLNAIFLRCWGAFVTSKKPA